MLYPAVPVGRSEGGARNEFSTYLHLIVNWLEHDALCRVVGEERALENTRAQQAYRWIYQTVLTDSERIGEVVREHGLALG